MKLVSCILPVNSDPGFLDEAVVSVLNQSYPQLELIIAANNCSDELWEHIQNYGDARIKSIRTPIGQLPHALNLAIDHSCGFYLARMDADDISMPQRFEKQVEFLEQHSDYHLVGSGFNAIDASGHNTHYFRNFYESNNAIMQALPITCAIYHPTVMMRRSFVLELQGYAGGLSAEDYDLWLRGRRAGIYKYHNLPEQLLHYRIHSSQFSSAHHEGKN